MRNWRTTVVEIISFLLIVLFVYTAVSKLLNPVRFQVALSKSPLLTGYAQVLSWFIPVTELAISLALLIPASRKAGLGLSFLLMLIFTGYIGWMLLTASRLPCACGGVISSMGWEGHFLFNGVFTILALTGWIFLRNADLFPDKPNTQKTINSLFE